jgi:hypothetical protein
MFSGNSLRGVEFYGKLVERYSFHTFDIFWENKLAASAFGTSGGVNAGGVYADANGSERDDGTSILNLNSKMSAAIQNNNKYPPK